MPRVAERPTVRRLFDRIDRDGSGDIDRDEVSNYLKELGVGSGFFGGQKVKQGAERFMSMFDNAPADGRVTWQEFVSNGRHLLPPGLTDGRGELDPALVDDAFQRIAPGKERASGDDVASYVEPQIKGAAALFAGTIAEAVAKLAVDALDTDGDQAFNKQDLLALLDDVNAQLKVA